MLDALAAAGGRATFFVQGRWATAYPERAARIGADGHAVGNHSHYHARMPMFTARGLESDVRAADQALAAAGLDPRPWFRCPFGAGHRDALVRARLARLGYRVVGWDVDPVDWEPATTAEHLVESVVRGAGAVGDGAVVLLHAWPSVTGVALPRLLDRLGRDGWTAVGIDELPDERLAALRFPSSG